MLEPAGQPGPRTPPVTPQLALRVAILGGIAFALFAIVFLRLWFMQVLTGDRYRQDALDNRVRTVAISAPRGSIRDRDGDAIVENRVATVVQLDPRKLPQAERDDAAHLGPADDPALEAAQGPPRRAARDPGARDAAARGALREPGARARRLPAPRQPERHPAARRPALREHPREGRRAAVDAQLPAGAPAGLPGHRRAAGLPAPLPARHDRGADPRHERRDQPRGDRHQGLPRRPRRDGRRPGRPRALLRPLPARHRRRAEHHRRRRRPAEGAADRACAAARARAAHHARPAAAAVRPALAQHA